MNDYEIVLIVDAGAAFEPVQKLISELNANLATIGVDKQIKCNSRITAGIVTVTRHMSDAEVKQMRTIIHAEFLTSNLPFAKSILGVELVHRKPGNVLQSAS